MRERHEIGSLVRVSTLIAIVLSNRYGVDAEEIVTKVLVTTTTGLAYVTWYFASDATSIE